MAAKSKTKFMVVRERAATIQRNTGFTYLASGAVLMFLANSDMVKKSEWAQKTWWLVPAVMIVLGIILHRRGSRFGAPLLVAGAMLFVLYWQQQTAKTTNTTTDTTRGVETEVTNNGMRWRLERDGTITMLGGSNDTGSTQREVAVNMADAIFRRAA